jgi:hypothetical protein
MASKAATKNGLVLSSLPAVSGIVVRSHQAPTECEFDLASTQIAETGSTLGSQSGQQLLAMLKPLARPHKPDGVLNRVKAKPLCGGPKGPALTRSARAILQATRGRDEEVVLPVEQRGEHAT